MSATGIAPGKAKKEIGWSQSNELFSARGNSSAPSKLEACSAMNVHPQAITPELLLILDKAVIFEFLSLRGWMSLTQMSLIGPGPEEKAIVVPSGDQFGQLFSASSVKRTGDPPEKDTIQMSCFPLRLDTKTILFPSGDQKAVSSSLGSKVICRSPSPEADMIQISKLPARFEAKAICDPSGDQAG